LQRVLRLQPALALAHPAWQQQEPARVADQPAEEVRRRAAERLVEQSAARRRPARRRAAERSVEQSAAQRAAVPRAALPREAEPKPRERPE